MYCLSELQKTNRNHVKLKDIRAKRKFPQASQRALSPNDRCTIFLKKLQDQGLLSLSDDQNHVILLKTDDNISEQVNDLVNAIKAKHPNFSLA